jgi:hypothetical protein
MSRKLYAYQWPDGDLTLLMAADRGDAFHSLDQISGEIDLARLKRVSERLFALTLRVDAAGRLVLASEANAGCDVLSEVLDEYGMRPYLSAHAQRENDEDDSDSDDDSYEAVDKAWQRLKELHDEADKLAVQYVRSRLTPDERTALDSQLPSTVARVRRRREIEDELALPLPKLKARLKASTRQWMKDYASYLGDVVTPEQLQAQLRDKFKQIDAMTDEDQARGQAELREELAALEAEQTHEQT